MLPNNVKATANQNVVRTSLPPFEYIVSIWAKTVQSVVFRMDMNALYIISIFMYLLVHIQITIMLNNTWMFHSCSYKYFNERSEVYVLTWCVRHFVYMSLSRLQPHAFTDCHAILNQRTWWKGREMCVNVLFISLPLQKVSMFHSYGRRSRFTIDRETSLIL